MIQLEPGTPGVGVENGTTPCRLSACSMLSSVEATLVGNDRSRVAALSETTVVMSRPQVGRYLSCRPRHRRNGHRLLALIHGRWLMIDGMVAGGRCLGGKQSSDHPRTDQETENVDQDDIGAVRCHCSEHRRYSIGCDQETKSPSQRPTGSGHRSAHRPTFQSLQSRSHRRWYPWLQSNARALLTKKVSRRQTRRDDRPTLAAQGIDKNTP